MNKGIKKKKKNKEFVRICIWKRTYVKSKSNYWLFKQYQNIESQLELQLALPSLFIEVMYICILSSPFYVLNFQALSSLLLITTRSEYVIVLVLSNSCQHFYEQVLNLVYVIHCLFFFSTIGSFTRFLLLILAFFF